MEIDASKEQHNSYKLIGSHRSVQKLQVTIEVSHLDQSDSLVRREQDLAEMNNVTSLIATAYNSRKDKS